MGVAQNNSVNQDAIHYIRRIIQDPYLNPDYRVCRTPNDLYDYLTPLSPINPLLAEDTESLPGGKTYCHTFSLKPGTGRLIYTADELMVKEYRYVLKESISYVHQLFHNYLHDVVAFEELQFPIVQFTDTMVRAYNLCLGGGGDDETESRAGRGSLGLKVLAYRLCHMRMKSFKDTVYPYSTPRLLEWLDLVSAVFSPTEYPSVCVCGHRSALHAIKGKRLTHSGSCSLCSCLRHKKGKPEKHPDDRQHGYLCRKAANLITAVLNKETETEWDVVDEEDDEPYSLIDPWKRIKNWHDHDRKFIAEYGIGPAPPPSIADVPEKELLFYACRDADSCLRVFLHMQTFTPWVFYR